MNLDAMVNCALRALSNAGPPYTVTFANPHSIVVSRHDRLFRTALEQAPLVAPDGSGVVLASRLCGGKVKNRVTGSDFFETLSQVLNAQGGSRYFFLGSSPRTLDALRAKFQKLYPSITFAGAFSPPYKDSFSADETAQMISSINSAKADVLWVGMTAPKQEKWIYLNAASLNVKLIGAIGAVFDYFSGQIRRPGKAWRACGMEWFPRLIQEPKRLWRRNLFSSPQFLYLAARERLLFTMTQESERNSR